MPKTPDEIKEAMLHCSPVSCRSTGCPYKADTPKYEGDMPVCRMKLWHDMRHLIQQLEAERDAAVKDIKEAHDSFCGCVTCKNYRVNADCHEPPSTFCPNCSHDDCPCKGCSSKLENWQWRGVQKEE